MKLVRQSEGARRKRQLRRVQAEDPQDTEHQGVVSRFEPRDLESKFFEFISLKQRLSRILIHFAMPACEKPFNVVTHL